MYSRRSDVNFFDMTYLSRRNGKGVTLRSKGKKIMCFGAIFALDME
jgi:hypothetical protein